jgi:tRNA threonylcarbamoyl adenosine modification protein (Sua5/YciO/YrdC/YwlC family)
MKSQPMVVPFWSSEEVEAAINGTLAHLAAGKVLAYPTETVYGFGGAIDERSVQQLVNLKGRPQGKPFLLLVAASEMITRLGLHLTGYASTFAARFWPGPLTLVLPGGEKRVPDRVRGPEGGVAVRWTPHRSLARLILAHGHPITPPVQTDQAYRRRPQRIRSSRNGTTQLRVARCEFSMAAVFASHSPRRLSIALAGCPESFVRAPSRLRR